MQLCDAFDIPVLNLIDCPGIMVGPEVERTALVRHCTRLFNVGANMTAPLYEQAKAVNAVVGGGIDDVIDPAHAEMDYQQPEALAAATAEDDEEISVRRYVVRPQIHL